MKDYADQQRRLHQDISNFMTRNRDLTRQVEEAEQKKQEESSRVEKEASQEETNIPSPPYTEEPVVTPILASPDEVSPPEDINDVQNEAGHNITSEDSDIKGGLLDSARRGDQLQLNLVPVSHITTLESPAFIPECSLPIVTPPSEEEVAREVAAYTAACATQDIPVEFPPSPMSPSAKLPSFEDSLHESNKSDDPIGKTNTRRQFVISKVEESIPAKYDSIQHSTICQMAESDCTGSSTDNSAKPFIEQCDNLELDNVCGDTDLNENKSHETQPDISDSHVSTEMKCASVEFIEDENIIVPSPQAIASSNASGIVNVNTTASEPSDPNHNSLDWADGDDKIQDTSNSLTLNGVTQAIAEAMDTFEREKPVELLKTTSEQLDLGM